MSTNIPEVPIVMAGFLIALAISGVLNYFFKAVETSGAGRLESIDGLRGYLAFSVFLHHSYIWYFYFHTDVWKTPSSYLFTHLGQSAVALFFMITSFLFTSKIKLNSPEVPINWPRLYRGRWRRLAPLYYFSLVCIFILAFVQTGFHMNESTPKLVEHLADWSSFTILGHPDINRLHNTFLLNAGIAWTLPYEWLFYFCLPILFIFVKRRFTSKKWMLLGLIALVMSFKKAQLMIVLGFGGGIIAAEVVTHPSLVKLLRSRIVSLFVLLLVVFLLGWVEDAHNLLAVFLLTLIFLPIACGNSLFGLLTIKPARFLGDISYSIYALHGIIIYTAYNFIFGVENLTSKTWNQYWVFPALLVPFLILFCFITYEYIEKPFFSKKT